LPVSSALSLAVGERDIAFDPMVLVGVREVCDQSFNGAQRREGQHERGDELTDARPLSVANGRTFCAEHRAHMRRSSGLACHALHCRSG